MLKILFSIHLFPPKHLCGAEMYSVAMIKMMQAMGHSVRVYLHRWPGAQEGGVYVYDGIEVFPPISDEVKNELFNWADIIVTHLDFARYSVEKGRLIGGKPVIFVTHNTSHYYDDMVNGNQHTFVIYNSEHAQKELDYSRPSMVMEPQIDMERVKVSSNTKEFITLINLCENKGVKQFYEIARLMPDKKFLGVKGSYMDQELDCPSNVTIWDKCDIKKVYEKTAVLLMPSDYESYGMTASEALVNGIPVICSPTDGLKENCGDGAQYLDRNDVKKWVSLTRKLDSSAEYKRWSQAGLQRSATRPNRFTELQTFLHECIVQYQAGRAIRA